MSDLRRRPTRWTVGIGAFGLGVLAMWWFNNLYAWLWLAGLGALMLRTYGPWCDEEDKA